MINGGSQSGRKVVTHNSKSDLPLVGLKKRDSSVAAAGKKGVTTFLNQHLRNVMCRPTNSSEFYAFCAWSSVPSPTLNAFPLN